MGIALRPPTVSVDRRIAAAPAEVWRLLVDIRQWPNWGPSVRSAELDGGGWELGPGSRGTVCTAVGVRLPFTVTRFDSGRRWNWSVAGIPATGHEVVECAGGCRVTFEAPWWAAAYLPVCAAALVRLEKLAR
ncbi:MAG: SRPBCC family protein [Mycobacterium sp.]